jgi:hypothetical protein
MGNKLLLWRECPRQNAGMIRSERFKKFIWPMFQGRRPLGLAAQPVTSGFRGTPPDPGQRKIRRQIMKIHGVSRMPEGELLFAVSFAKAKSFHYLTHKEMIEMYPNCLIGFYERNIQFGPVATVERIVASDLAHSN